MWLKLLFQELNTPCLIDVTGDSSTTHLAIYFIIIHFDNQGAIALRKNAQAHARSKYIDIQWHYQREKIEDETVELWYISTDQQIADGLITYCQKTNFWYFKMQLAWNNSQTRSTNNGRAKSRARQKAYFDP